MDNVKNNTQKKVIISTAIGIVSMLIIIVGATYAYWNAKGSVNFNTATITYETEDKSIIVLNGTTGLLTLGTIEGKDMPKVANNIVYYAGEEDKSRTPQEVTIGVASYDEAADENIYRCTFTLSLTHSGTADLIDRFLSENYTNRSAGQIIITVNGVEYDINDGFPSTITGYTDVDIYHPGAINVGMKFVNIGTLNQDYLTETNGHININVTSFNCQAKKETTKNVFYWSSLPEKVANSADHPLINLSNYHSFHNNASVQIQYAKKFDDYHDLMNQSYSRIVINSNTNLYRIRLYIDNEFSTLSKCEEFLNEFHYNDYYEYSICVADSGKYKISRYDVTLNGDSYEIDNQVMVALRYGTKSSCEKAKTIIQSNNSLKMFYATSSNGVDNYGTLPSDSSISCETEEIYNPIFVKTTIIPNRSDKDLWQLFYTHAVYKDELMCNFETLDRYNHASTMNIEESCVLKNGYYYRQTALINDTIDYYNLIYSQFPGRFYNIHNEKVFFDSEAECNEILEEYFMDETETPVCDAFHCQTSIDTVPLDNRCLHTISPGDVYYTYKSEICMYVDGNVICMNEEDDEYINNREDFYDYLESYGFDCNFNNGVCTKGNDYLVHTYTKDSYQATDDRITYTSPLGYSSSCFVNNIYGGEFGIYCDSSYESWYNSTHN